MDRGRTDRNILYAGQFTHAEGGRMASIGECTKTIDTAEGTLTIYSLRDLEAKGIVKDLGKIPYSIRVLMEGVLRQRGETISDDDVRNV